MSKSAWPYDSMATGWPPVEPQNIDQLAKENRTGAYQRLSSLNEIKVLNANGHVVLVTLDITNQWFTARNGIIKMPRKTSDFTENHAIVICGYEDKKSRLLFRNCWGGDWGQNGNGYLPYDYFKNYFTEAWAITMIQDSCIRSPAKGIGIYNWAIPDLHGGILHCIQVYDNRHNELLAWSFCVVRKNYLNVEELFVKPDYRRKGYGKMIITDINRLAAALKKTVRYLIPHSEDNQDSLILIDKLFSPFKIGLKAAKVNWCSYFGLKIDSK